MKQLPLIPKSSLEHGGEHRRGRRKTRRPLDTRLPTHVVLRSSRARGSWSLLHPRNRVAVRDLVLKAARRQGIRVMSFVNVGNHLHLIVKARSRGAFQNFLRQAAGQVAQAVTGAIKGGPVRGRFWDSLAYSRVVSWGRDLLHTVSYLVKNLAQSLGLPDPRRSGGTAALIIPRGAGPPIEEVWFKD